jgi:hypothetical protein
VGANVDSKTVAVVFAIPVVGAVVILVVAARLVLVLALGLAPDCGS